MILEQELARLTPALLVKQPSDKLLNEVARRSVSSVLELGIQLGLEQCDVVNRLPTELPIERKIELLLLWKRQKGNLASNRTLLTALYQCGSDTSLLQTAIEIILFENTSHDEDRVAMAEHCDYDFENDTLKCDYNALKNVHDTLKITHDSLKSDHDSLKSDHDSLRTAHDSLRTAHDSLKSDHDSLKSDHDSLRTAHDSLKSDHDSLRTAHDSLKSDHDSLKSDHDSLRTTHDSLKSDHDSLKSDHDSLKTEYDSKMNNQKKCRLLTSILI